MATADTRSVLLDDYHFVLVVPEELAQQHGVLGAIRTVLERREAYRHDQYLVLDPAFEPVLYRTAVTMAQRHMKKRGGRAFIVSRHEGLLDLLVSGTRRRVHLRIIKLDEPVTLKDESPRINFDPTNGAPNGKEATGPDDGVRDRRPRRHPGR